MPVALTMRGPAEERAPAPVEAAVYRVVQEALTNAAKHAPGARVTVEVDRSRDRTRVAVINTAPPGAEQPVGPGGGLRLAGLRERVRLVGGVLRAGPLPDGGFRVEATLPHTRPASVSVEASEGAGPDGEAGTVSARQLARRRRRLRRALVATVAAPAALLAGVGAVMVAYYAHATVASVLPPATFARITVGQTRAEIDPLLPDRTLWGGAAPTDPPAPPGTDCVLYRPDADLLGLREVYRLCFAGDRLVAKDVIIRRSAEDAEP